MAGKALKAKETPKDLGAAVGTVGYKRCYAKAKIDRWIETVKSLAKIAEVEPHAAFTAYTRSLQCQWTFLARVMPDISDLFEPLEHIIRTVFIKTLIKRDANDVEWDMLGLPARLGGLGITNPVISTPLSHTNSLIISSLLVKLIRDQEAHMSAR